MPEASRPWRRPTTRLLPRTVSHLVVLGLVAASITFGLAAGSGAVDGRGFFDFIAAPARGAAAGDNILDVVGNGHTATYDLAPDPNEVPEPSAERGDRVMAVAAEPTPLPTPVPPPKPRVVRVTTTTYAPIVGNGMLLWPVPGGRITQYYSTTHRALDIGAPYGSTVIASAGGTVTWAGWRDNGGGLVVAIDHGNGLRTVYNHLASIWVSAGATVARGQGIAAVGCTGVCTGPHVHYEVIVDGVLVNPLRYL